MLSLLRHRRLFKQQTAQHFRLTLVSSPASAAVRFSNWSSDKTRPMMNLLNKEATSVWLAGSFVECHAREEGLAKWKWQTEEESILNDSLSVTLKIRFTFKYAKKESFPLHTETMVGWLAQLRRICQRWSPLEQQFPSRCISLTHSLTCWVSHIETGECDAWHDSQGQPRPTERWMKRRWENSKE